LELSLTTGGCVKFDLKALDDNLHQALTGAGNRRTPQNLECAARPVTGIPHSLTGAGSLDWPCQNSVV